MSIEATIDWRGELAFSARQDGFEFMIDAAPVEGDLRGPKPKGLLLVSLAGCSAMDVISILTKMKKNVTAFSVRAEGTVAKDHPRRVESIHLTYTLSGEGIDAESVQKAVDLSQAKYCGVYATLTPKVAVTHEIIVKSEPQRG